MGVMDKLRFLSPLAVACLVASACTTALPTPSPSSTSSAPFMQVDNPCAYVAPEPTPTPFGGTPTPRPTNTPVPTPPGPTLTPAPEIEIPEYPDIHLQAPDTINWADAVVVVDVSYVGFDSVHRIQGLVIESDGHVLTTLNPEYNISTVEVVVDGTSYPAEIVRRDPRTDGALLQIDADGLTAVPSEQADVQVGQPALAWIRQPDGSLSRQLVYVSPTENAPDDLAALLRYRSRMVPAGTLVTDMDDGIIGITQDSGYQWVNYFSFVSGPAPGPDQPIVLMKSASHLLANDPGTDASIPARLAYYGPGWGTFYDGPVSRDEVATAVAPLFSQIGQPVDMPALGREGRWRLSSDGEHALQLLYLDPQALSSKDGSSIGSAPYIGLLWGRSGGQPDLLLCGQGPDRVSAAFEMPWIGSLESVMSAVPHGSRSVVRAVQLPEEEQFDFSSYPYRWHMETDKETYAPGEPVKFTISVKNISKFNIPLDYFPPMIRIQHSGQTYDVAITGYGDQSESLEPGQSVTVTAQWDGLSSVGDEVISGGYHAEAIIANAQTIFGPAGPQANFAVASN